MCSGGVMWKPKAKFEGAENPPSRPDGRSGSALAHATYRAALHAVLVQLQGCLMLALDKNRQKRMPPVGTRRQSMLTLRRLRHHHANGSSATMHFRA